MNDQEKFSDQIDRYLEGNLSDIEKLRLNDEINTNPEFKEKVRKQILLIRGIRRYGRNELSRKISEWEMEIHQERESTVPSEKKVTFWYYAAATISLLLVFSAIFIYISGNNNTESIIAEFYSPYEFTNSQTRGNEEKNLLYNDILTFYQQGDYEQTISMIQSAGPDLHTVDIRFLLGNAYQASGRLEEAKEVFEKLSKEESAFRFGSQWYLSLCYLASDQKEQAIDLLEELSGTASSYAPKAKDLLKKLEN